MFKIIIFHRRNRMKINEIFDIGLREINDKAFYWLATQEDLKLWQN